MIWIKMTSSLRLVFISLSTEITTLVNGTEQLQSWFNQTDMIFSWKQKKQTEVSHVKV